VKEIPLTIYHYGNGISILDSLFDKIPINEHQSTWSKEKIINEDITIVQDGAIIRESKFAIQDRYVKFLMKEVNSINKDFLVEFIYKKLSKNDDIKNIGIRDKELKVSITKESIKKIIEEFLES